MHKILPLFYWISMKEKGRRMSDFFLSRYNTFTTDLAIIVLAVRPISYDVYFLILTIVPCDYRIL